MDRVARALVDFDQEIRSDGQRINKAAFDQFQAAIAFAKLLASDYPNLNPAQWPYSGDVYYNSSGPDTDDQIMALAHKTASEFVPPKQIYPPSAFTI